MQLIIDATCRNPPGKRLIFRDLPSNHHAINCHKQAAKACKSFLCSSPNPHAITIFSPPAHAQGRFPFSELTLKSAYRPCTNNFLSTILQVIQPIHYSIALLDFTAQLLRHPSLCPSSQRHCDLRHVRLSSAAHVSCIHQNVTLCMCT